MNRLGVLLFVLGLMFATAPRVGAAAHDTPSGIQICQGFAIPQDLPPGVAPGTPSFMVWGNNGTRWIYSVAYPSNYSGHVWFWDPDSGQWLLQVLKISH